MNLMDQQPRVRLRGFTLIELLIVIAIILILIAIALPNFLEAQIRAKVAQAKGNARTIATAMEAYLIDFRTYPTDHDWDQIDQKGLNQLTSPLKYLAELPEEPFARAGGLLDPGSDEIGWEMGSTGVPLMFTPFRKPKINAFGLASYGPDVNDDFPCGDPWPECQPLPPGNPCLAGSDGAGWTDYSPTNGTKSNGDLMQLGGEIKTGNYCVNGWQVIQGYYPIPPN